MQNSTTRRYWRLSIRWALLVLCGYGSSCFPPSLVQADIRLPKIFANSMVLQRQAEVHLSGLADPNEVLTFSIRGQAIDPREIKTHCNERGEFSIRFMPPPVGGPYELLLSGEKSRVLIRDVMVGDVWLCAGQSNMEWPINKTEATEVAATEAERPQLRLFSVPRTTSPQPLNDFAGNTSWSHSTSQVAAEYSAVAWHFASRLEQELHVPIGVINASFGGTKAESWISQTGLTSEPALEPLVAFGETLGESTKPHDRLSSLYNGMIAPLHGYPIKGVVWYQGEANVGRGDQYRILLPTLIHDWRAKFQSPQLPFLFVQLAPYRYKNHSPQALPEVWDAQLSTLHSVPRTGMIVITDLGNFDDIHPLKKRDVGLRLSEWALAEVYRGQQLVPHANGQAPTDTATDSKLEQAQNDMVVQELSKSSLSEGGSGAPNNGVNVVYSGPIYRNARIDGSQIVVDFFAAAGLRSIDDQPLREFMLAGEDQVFHKATAVIVDQQVVVTCEEVPNPMAVRYCWNDTPAGNLVNQAGLPASPFRSDQFPLLSAGKHH